MQTKFTIEEIRNYLEVSGAIEMVGDLNEQAIIDANLYHIYSVNADWQCHIKPLNEFTDWVREHNIGPNQISSYPAINEFEDIRYNKNIELCLYPASHLFLNNVPDTCTHVVWFSK